MYGMIVWGMYLLPLLYLEAEAFSLKILSRRLTRLMKRFSY